MANTVLSGQVLDSSIVAIWMTTAANTHFCKISEDVDGRSEAIIEVFLWRTLIGVGSGRIFALLASLPFG